MDMELLHGYGTKNKEYIWDFKGNESALFKLPEVMSNPTPVKLGNYIFFRHNSVTTAYKEDGQALNSVYSTSDGAVNNYQVNKNLEYGDYAVISYTSGSDIIYYLFKISTGVSTLLKNNSGNSDNGYLCNTVGYTPFVYFKDNNIIICGQVAVRGTQKNTYALDGNGTALTSETITDAFLANLTGSSEQYGDYIYSFQAATLKKIRISDLSVVAQLTINQPSTFKIINGYIYILNTADITVVNCDTLSVVSTTTLVENSFSSLKCNITATSGKYIIVAYVSTATYKAYYYFFNKSTNAFERYINAGVLNTTSDAYYGLGGDYNLIGYTSYLYRLK